MVVRRASVSFGFKGSFYPGVDSGLLAVDGRRHVLKSVRAIGAEPALERGRTGAIEVNGELLADLHRPVGSHRQLDVELLDTTNAIR